MLRRSILCVAIAVAIFGFPVTSLAARKLLPPPLSVKPTWGVQAFQVHTLDAADLARKFEALKRIGIGRVYVRLFHQSGDRMQGGVSGDRKQPPARHAPAQSSERAMRLRTWR